MTVHRRPVSCLLPGRTAYVVAVYLVASGFVVGVSRGYDVCASGSATVKVGSGAVSSPLLRRDDGSKMYPTNADCRSTLTMPAGFAGEISTRFSELRLRGCTWRWASLRYECPDYVQLNGGDRLCSCGQRVLPEKLSNIFYGNVTIAFLTTPSDTSQRGTGFTLDYSVRGCDVGSLSVSGRQEARLVPSGKPSEPATATVVCSPHRHIWDAARRENVSSVSGIKCVFADNSWERAPQCAAGGESLLEQGATLASRDKSAGLVTGIVVGIVGAAITIAAVSVVAARRSLRRRRVFNEIGAAKAAAPTYSHLDASSEEHIYTEMGTELESARNWQGTLQMDPDVIAPAHMLPQSKRM